MMDYKEKYDAALERARKELQEFKNKDCDDITRRTVINIVRNLFPELLMESEDERIRKGIIRNLQYLMDRSEGFVKEDLQERIAWLEKQDKRDARYKYLEELLEADTEYQIAMNDAMVEEAKTKAMEAISNMCIFELLGLEKQGEQPTDKIELNPAWSEEDEGMLKWLCRIIHTQRLDRTITLKEESELGKWIDKWLNHNPQPKQCEHLENYDKEERIRKGLIKAVSRIFEGYKLFDTDVTREEALAWLEKQNDKDKLIKEYEKYINWLEKQAEPNPYSGTSFKYNSHTWGMCARDNGVEILFDGELKAFLSLEKSFIYPIYPKPDLAHKSAIEAIKDNVDNNNKVKPKFHEGDWVILTAGELSTTLQIVNVDTNKRLYWFNDSSYLPIVDEDCLHLWTINDAKNGDVLSFYLEYKGNKMVQTGIIEKYVGKHGGCSNTFKVYVGVDWENNFQIGEHMGCSDIRPATKEQQDMLFEKIKNAGYEWNTAKKKLKKIKL